MAVENSCSGDGIPAYLEASCYNLSPADATAAGVYPKGLTAAFAAHVEATKHGRTSRGALGAASASRSTSSPGARVAGGASGGSGSWGIRAAIIPEFDGDVLALALSDTYVNSLEHGRNLALANVRAVSAAGSHTFGASSAEPASGAGADSSSSLNVPPMLRRISSAGVDDSRAKKHSRARLGVEVLRECYGKLVEYVDGGFESHRADEELVEFVNEAARNSDWSAKKVLRVTWDEVLQAHPIAKDKGEEASLKSYPHLRRLPEGDRRGRLAARFRLLQTVNNMVAKALPWIDLSRALEPASLASRISQISRLIFEAIKLPMFLNAVERTKGPSTGETNIQVDRLRPTARLGGGLKDTEGRHTVFS